MNRLRRQPRVPVRTAALLAGWLAIVGLPAAPPASLSTGVVGAGQYGPQAAAEQSGAYRWPLDGAIEIARTFDPPLQRWQPGHRGVDLAAAPAQVVRAAGDGTVFFAGPVAGRPVVSIQHAGGLRTTYEPVVPLIAAGDPVRAGDPVGMLLDGHAGCPAAACLHWGLRRDDHYLDPLMLLGLGRVRLLPS